ncbi:MAG: 5'-nucleotidase [Planctomycetota bacterium]
MDANMEQSLALTSDLDQELTECLAQPGQDTSIRGTDAAVERLAPPDAAASQAHAALMTVAVEEAALVQTQESGAVPGEAYRLVQKLGALESRYQERDVTDKPYDQLVDIAVITSPTQNQPPPGNFEELRNRSLQELETQTLMERLGPHRTVPHADEGGPDKVPADLYIAKDPDKAQVILENGGAAVFMLDSERSRRFESDPEKVQAQLPLSVAFDADKVFVHRSDDDRSQAWNAEMGRERGLQHWKSWQMDHADQDPGPGPLAPVMEKFMDMKKVMGGSDAVQVNVITARFAEGAERLLHRLDGMGLRQDPENSLNALIMTGGHPKVPLVKALGADVLFDDHPKNFIDPVDGTIMPHAAQVPVPGEGPNEAL